MGNSPFSELEQTGTGKFNFASMPELINDIILSYRTKGIDSSDLNCPRVFPCIRCCLRELQSYQEVNSLSYPDALVLRCCKCITVVECNMHHIIILLPTLQCIIILHLKHQWEITSHVKAKVVPIFAQVSGFG